MSMLEKMADFFAARLEGYEAHQLDCIEGAREFYPFTAALLPRFPGARVLDLGCGTGLELDYFFAQNPDGRVTGIDLAAELLDVLRRKHAGRDLTLLCGSYFDLPLGEAEFDAAVSVESLHHFTMGQKLPLYKKVFDALKPGGYFVLTDYFAANDEQERFFRRELERLKAEQGIDDGDFYHYDTPLTLSHEREALEAAGFGQIEILGRWENTRTLKAAKLRNL